LVGRVVEIEAEREMAGRVAGRRGEGRKRRKNAPVLCSLLY